MIPPSALAALTIGRAQAAPDPVSMALRPSRSSPRSRRRSASACGPVSRIGSRPTTSNACIPRSGTRHRLRHESAGSSAYRPQHRPSWCAPTCRLQSSDTPTITPGASHRPLASPRAILITSNVSQVATQRGDHSPGVAHCDTSPSAVLPAENAPALPKACCRNQSVCSLICGSPIA